MSFEQAIAELANPPGRKGSQAQVSYGTTEAEPEPALELVQVVR